MFITSNKPWKEKNTKTVTIKCTNCGNTTENFVMGTLSGYSVGLVFMPKKTHLGKKQYFLCCAICGNANKEISTEELKLLK